MTDLKVLLPGPNHPISIDEASTRVTVTLGGRVVADSQRALTLREASYPPVQYIPLADVAPDVLRPSDHTSWCPFKGEARYYDIAVGDDVVPPGVWTYPEPHDAVAQIRDHVAFFPDRVDSIVVHGEG
jgi:uncharacterized protein (DUF427 family)